MGKTHLKRCATSVRFISTHFHAESSVMRQKTKVSVSKIWLRFGLWEIHGTKEPRYPGQKGDRRQIAQWAGTRTTHPGKAGFETGPCPKPGCESACFPQGLFPSPKKRPWVFRRQQIPISIENLGIACGHSRRGFFRAQKHATGLFDT